jgi:hypothetical protein
MRTVNNEYTQTFYFLLLIFVLEICNMGLNVSFDYNIFSSGTKIASVFVYFRCTKVDS